MNKTIPIPSRDQITSMQVNTLLGSLATLLPFFAREHNPIQGGAQDGGTQAAPAARMAAAGN